ncbi:MAG: LTA synthase family protein [Lachnospiraceae bacterium]|nr:LTA synthase family protein [Lachnospiraceae bacterium]
MSKDINEKENYNENENALGVEDTVENTPNRITVILLNVLKFILPFILFILVTCLEYVSIELFSSADLMGIELPIAFKNIIFIAILNVGLFCLIHYLKPTLIISEVIFLVWGLINYFLFEFRGYGLVVMDFMAVKTAKNVAGAYSYSVDSYFFGGLMVIILCLVITWIYPSWKHKYYHPYVLVLMVLGIASIAGFVRYASTNKSFFKNVSSLTWDHSIGMKNYGYILYAVTNASTDKVEKPMGYSVKKVDEILDRYKEDENGEKNANALSASSGEAPNIIVVMNESFSDLKVLGNVKTDKKYNTTYESIEDNAIKGYVESSVYGGYTSISEFEFLSGMSGHYISGNPYLQYIKDYIPNFVTRIKENEEYNEVVAIHPYKSSGYNRERVYPLLGFDKFYDIHSFEDAELVRDKYVSDRACYEKIEELYEKKDKDEKLCVFNVTMQNHNPYTIDYVFDDPVKLKNMEGEDEAEQYLSLIRESDKAFKELIDYFKEQEEPTLIVMFGDHQPHLNDSFYKKASGNIPENYTILQSMDLHKVPFVIWGNYDIGYNDVGTTSINYISSILMDKAGLKMSDLDRFLLDTKEQLPSVSTTGYIDKNGAIHPWYDTKIPDKERVKEYSMVVYNYLYDTENRLDEHYNVE